MQDLLNYDYHSWITLYRDFGSISAVCITFIEAFLSFLPLTAFVALNTAAFGVVKGVILSSIGSILGCWLLYWVTRKYHYHPWIQKLMQNTQYVSIKQKFLKQGILLLTLWFFVPFLPNFFMTVVAGINKMDFKKFALCSALGIILQFIVIGIGTENLMLILKNPLYLILACVLLVGYYVFSRKFTFEMEA